MLLYGVRSPNAQLYNSDLAHSDGIVWHRSPGEAAWGMQLQLHLVWPTCKGDERQHQQHCGGPHCGYVLVRRG